MLRQVKAGMVDHGAALGDMSAKPLHSTLEKNRGRIFGWMNVRKFVWLYLWLHVCYMCGFMGGCMEALIFRGIQGASFFFFFLV